MATSCNMSGCSSPIRETLAPRFRDSSDKEREWDLINVLTT